MEGQLAVLSQSAQSIPVQSGFILRRGDSQGRPNRPTVSLLRRLSLRVQYSKYVLQVQDTLSTSPLSLQERRGGKANPSNERLQAGCSLVACTGTETEQLRPTMLCSYCTIPTSVDIRKRALRT